MKSTRELGEFCLGAILSLVGLIMFLSNVKVNSSSLFYKVGKVNIGGILLILLLISVVLLVIKRSTPYVFLFIGLLITMVVSIILAIDIKIVTMSGLEIVTILGTLGVGIGLLLKVLLFKK